MDTEGVSQIDELELNNLIGRLPENEKEKSRKIIRLCLELLKAGKAEKAVKLLESSLTN